MVSRLRRFLSLSPSRHKRDKMPSAGCCTNCRTKYSIFNQEEGCSNCALSFCKKCVEKRAVIPHLSPHPVTVCAACYEACMEKKRQQQQASVTSAPLPTAPPRGRTQQAHTYSTLGQQHDTNTPNGAAHSYSSLGRQVYPDLKTTVTAQQPHSYSRLGQDGGRGAAVSPSAAAARPHAYSSMGQVTNNVRSGTENVAHMYPGLGQVSSDSQGVTHISIGTPTPAPAVVAAACPSTQSQWWGAGLPPPSFRQQHAAAPAATPAQAGSTVSGTSDLEQRLGELRADAPAPASSTPTASVDDIEKRLAALRGCDVELIRNPRSWFTSSSEPRYCDTVDGLLEMATEQAAIEERNDPVRYLEDRYKKMREEDEETLKGDDDNEERGEEKKEEKAGGGEAPSGLMPSNASTASRLSDMSVASQWTGSEFSTATKEELEDIKKLMGDARKRLAESEAAAAGTDEKERKEEEKRMSGEMKRLLADTRQQSLDIQKVGAEMERVFGKRIDGVTLSDDSDEDSLDEETVRRIVAEAEAAPEQKEEEEEKKKETGHVQDDRDSPKKKSLFGRIFKK